ncbi:hypothetical protein M1105_01795 [Limibaculum sp. FT325]|uniref:hypothetical protein n=1 Tax=Thermohalobaculum sediminis TaxID=2939436 RepID=UPI0020BF02CB|nr:hypothetical protein [Limibaculum sediminis]MCL5775730.1 hypothetical protein [Limibaculum sediminis]
MATPQEPAVVEIRLRTLGQLFESLDPSPFHERDLDRQAEAYVMGWARELPRHAPLVLRIHLPPPEAAEARAADLGTAVANHFTTVAASAEAERRDLFRLGWRYLAISLPLLAVCLVLARVATAVMGDGPMAEFVSTGLAILGWVVCWKPLETLLFDWLPVSRRRDLARRVATASVEIVESAPPAGLRAAPEARSSSDRPA